MTKPKSGNCEKSRETDSTRVQAIWETANRDQVPHHWWESAGAIKRILLKPDFEREYLSLEPKRLNSQLDGIQAQGYSGIEIFAPWDGGYSYHGLDTRDHYQLDPYVGTMDDFRRLIRTVHRRGMSIIIFCNLGYCAVEAPFFLEACDAIREGRDIEQVKWFWWSDIKEAPPPVLGNKTFLVFPQHLPGWQEGTYYNPEGEEFWNYSERAGKYYWTKWAGSDENGSIVRLPHYNWSTPELHQEVKKVITYWMDTGIDGMIVDAVNWYAGCDWVLNRAFITDVIASYGNAYSQPEGAGGFREDPVSWITEGGYNSVQDYGLGIWWEKDTNVIRNAIENGDPRLIEPALRNYHDRVRAFGGTLYYGFGKAEAATLSNKTGLDLYIANVASLGNLIAFWDIDISEEASWILKTKTIHPALQQMAVRRKLLTDADDKCYTFLNTAADKSERILVVLNFQNTKQKVKIDCSGISAKGFVDLRSNQNIPYQVEIEVELPTYGYRFFQVLPG
jgi:hypothetical protein